jgi:hypothetical protein
MRFVNSEKIPANYRLYNPLSLTPKTMNSPVTPFIATKSIYFFENVESRFYLQYRYLLFAVLNFAFNGIFKSR